MRLGRALARKACRDRRVEGDFLYRHAHRKQYDCTRNVRKDSLQRNKIISKKHTITGY